MLYPAWPNRVVWSIRSLMPSIPVCCACLMGSLPQRPTLRSTGSKKPRSWRKSKRSRSSWRIVLGRVSGSGAKLVNVSVKELLMSQAKVLGESNALLAKEVENSQRTCESVIALNENVKEGNQLPKELIERQRISIRHAAQNIAQQQASTPPPVPAPPVSMGCPGSSTIPAAFQNPALGVGKIPGTTLLQPPERQGLRR